MRLGRTTVWSLIAWVAACQPPASRLQSFDPAPFQSFDSEALLGFDLRPDDGRPHAGLIIRLSAADTVGRPLLPLPFEATGAPTDANLLVAIGRYPGFSIISYSPGINPAGAGDVPILPILGQRVEAIPQRDQLERGLYYWEDGLERWFVLVHGGTALVDSLQRAYPRTRFRQVKDVAVVLPAKAEGREVRRGLTIAPPPTLRAGQVAFFQGILASAEDPRVELRYVVPPTAAQAVASSGLAKVITLLLVPLFTLIFLPAKEDVRPRARRVAILVGFLLQGLAVLALLWLAVTARQTLTPSVLVDIGIALLGIAAQAVVLWFKKRPDPASSEPPLSLPRFDGQ